MSGGRTALTRRGVLPPLALRVAQGERSQRCAGPAAVIGAPPRSCARSDTPPDPPRSCAPPAPKFLSGARIVASAWTACQSPRARASFFVRLQPLTILSARKASSRVLNSSAKINRTGRRLAV